MTRIASLLAAVLLVLVVLPAADVAGAERGATLYVLGARVHPLKPKGKPWDADHRSIPLLVYHSVGGATGFPPLPILSLVPYRNRPDPYVVVEAGGAELARSRAEQGTFLPSWALEVPLPAGKALPPVITLRVMDDDLKDDDEIGKALIDTASVVSKPGVHTLEGTAGLYDVIVVVRNPGAASAGPVLTLRVGSVKLKAREQRPAGGDWDVGGNPLKRRFPKLHLPEELGGAEVVRPDLRVTLDWLGGGTKTHNGENDAFELDWKDVGLEVRGRAGIGDGLLIKAVDRDLALSDPVGVLYVPFELFLGSRDRGALVVKGDEENGIESAELTFSVR